MRIVMKTKKYQDPHNALKEKQEVPQQKEKQYQRVADAQSHLANDAALISAMKEAGNVPYDVCTVAAMQQFLDAQPVVAPQAHTELEPA